MCHNQNFKLIISYARGLCSSANVYDAYIHLSHNEQLYFWEQLLDLIQQAKCDMSDVNQAILSAGIKQTSTCCTLIKKGIFYHNLKRIASLSEERKSVNLLLNLFVQGYNRKIVDSNPEKWWNAKF